MKEVDRPTISSDAGGCRGLRADCETGRDAVEAERRASQVDDPYLARSEESNKSKYM